MIQRHVYNGIPLLTANALNHACEQVLGQSAIDMAVISSIENRLYSIVTIEGRYIFKVADRALESSLEYEFGIYKLLTDNALPCPNLVLLDRSRTRIASYWSLSELFGESLSRYRKNKSDNLFEQAGRLLARYHSLEFHAPGMLDSEGNVTEFSQNELLGQNETKRRLARLYDTQIITQIQLRQIESALDRFVPDSQFVFCHGDFTFPNILVFKNKVSYAREMQYAHSNSPWYDVSITEIFSAAWGFDFSAFRRGYESSRSLEAYDDEKFPYLLINLISRIPTYREHPNVSRFQNLLSNVLSSNQVAIAI